MSDIVNLDVKCIECGMVSSMDMSTDDLGNQGKQYTTGDSINYTDALEKRRIVGSVICPDSYCGFGMKITCHVRDGKITEVIKVKSDLEAGFKHRKYIGKTPENGRC